MVTDHQPRGKTVLFKTNLDPLSCKSSFSLRTLRQCHLLSTSEIISRSILPLLGLVPPFPTNSSYIPPYICACFPCALLGEDRFRQTVYLCTINWNFRLHTTTEALRKSRINPRTKLPVSRIYCNNLVFDLLPMLH